MNVIMTTIADRPVKHRTPLRHTGVRREPRPPSGKNFKFPEHFSTLPTGVRPMQKSQATVKEAVKNLTNYHINQITHALPQSSPGPARQDMAGVCQIGRSQAIVSMSV